MRCCKRQQGLTLLEVLIALSIFAMIGVTSYRVLNTVIESQKANSRHSQLLAATQKSLMVLSRDIQFWADRPVRTEATLLPSFILEDIYIMEFTRAGWRNPLQLSRSQLQRVAYDVGYHPDRDNNESTHFDSDTRYLRRHYWPVLDRLQRNQKPITQLLLADVEAFEVQVISDNDGKRERHKQWPKPSNNPSDGAPSEKLFIIGFELHIKHRLLGEISRIYRVN